MLCLVSALVLAGCSPTARHQLLTFFLDGVPPPGGDTASAEAEVSPQFITDDARRVVARPRMILHEPYRSSPCTTCHPRDRSFFLGEDFDRRGQCFSCHEHVAFRDELAGARLLHGPVALGECLVCHDPHESLHRGLLVAADPDLCLDCHQREAVLASGTHRGLDAAAPTCLPCHDPHGGNQPFFIRERAPQSAPADAAADGASSGGEP